jgi:hypothetical protein
MKLSQKILLVTGLFIGVIVTSLLTQAIASQPLASETLRENINSFISFANETTSLLTLYNEKKITTSYLTTQLTYINQQVLSFYTILQTKEIPANYQTSVERIGKNAFNFSLVLKAVEASPDDSNKRNIAIQEIQHLKKEFQNEQQHYE